MIIKLAKAFPRADLTGIDYWDADWQYLKAQCETNADIKCKIHAVIL